MYVTTYTRNIKRRKTGKVETVHTYYSTKSLTPMHAHIRATYAGSKTYADVKRVITHFCIGMPLDKPLVCGGTLVAA
jgi:hypothetical protein